MFIRGVLKSFESLFVRPLPILLSYFACPAFLQIVGVLLVFSSDDDHVNIWYLSAAFLGLSQGRLILSGIYLCFPASQIYEWFMSLHFYALLGSLKFYWKRVALER